MYRLIGNPKPAISALLLLLLMAAVACGSASQPAAPSQSSPQANDQAAASTVSPTSPQVPVRSQGTQPGAPAALPTPTPPQVAAGPKLNRVSIAVAPLGWDTNYNYKVTSSGLLDKRPVMENLVGVDPTTGAYVPQLAKSWEMSPDGKTWTVRLREGVQFHGDWGEFTAKDARHSFYILVQPTSAASTVNEWRSLAGVTKDDTDAIVTSKLEEKVEIVDDYTVKFHLEAVNTDWDYFMSEERNMPIESKARWDAVGDAGYGNGVIGTGPFKFVERIEGVRVMMERVDNHWRTTPEFKELEFRWVPEAATRLAALLTEEVQLSDLERDLQRDARAKGMKIISSHFPAMQHKWYFGGLWFTEPDKLITDNPFANIKVRQAMNKAINREAIARSLLPGSEVEIPSIYSWHPVLNKDQFDPQWYKDWDDLYGYDPVKAKQLMVEAGYPNGFQFGIYLFGQPGLPEMVDIGQAMALDYEKIGLKPKLINVEYTKVRDKYRSQTLGVEIFPSRSASVPITSVPVWFKTGGTGHGYNTAEIDALWDELGRTLPRDRRNELQRQMGDRVYREFAVIQMFAIKAEIAVNPKYIASYDYPGTITGYYTHLDQIKLAR